MEPGIPARNSSPASPACAACSATVASRQALPTTRPSASTVISAKPRAIRTTMPSSPPSRIITLEQAPRAITGSSGERRHNMPARSSASLGWNSHSAGPPTRNHVRAPSGACAVTRPRVPSKAWRTMSSKVVADGVVMQRFHLFVPPAGWQAGRAGPVPSW